MAQRIQSGYVGFRVVPGVCGADPPVAQRRGPAQRGIGFTATEDRYRLRWVWLNHHLGHLVVPAAPRHPATLPQRPQRRDHLVEAFTAVAELLAEQLVFLTHPTDP